MPRQYKNQNKGIYKILNTVNNKCYIGSTIQGFSKRWCDHRTLLYRSIHTNSYLQRAWNKYGKEAFVFVEQERLNDNSLTVNQIREREQYWIDNLKPEYNLSDVALYGEMTDYGKYMMVYNKGNRYHLISPKGIHYCSIDLKDFAKQHKLNAGSLRDLCSGKLHICKSWKGSIIKEDNTTPYLYTFRSKQRYLLTQPNGTQFCTYDLKHTCQEFNLSYTTMCGVGNGRKKQYKGWLASQINN